MSGLFKASTEITWAGLGPWVLTTSRCVLAPSS